MLVNHRQFFYSSPHCLGLLLLLHVGCSPTNQRHLQRPKNISQPTTRRKAHNGSQSQSIAT